MEGISNLTRIYGYWISTVKISRWLTQPSSVKNVNLENKVPVQMIYLRDKWPEMLSIFKPNAKAVVSYWY